MGKQIILSCDNKLLVLLLFLPLGKERAGCRVNVVKVVDVIRIGGFLGGLNQFAKQHLQGTRCQVWLSKHKCANCGKTMDLEIIGRKLGEPNSNTFSPPHWKNRLRNQPHA